MKEEIRNRDFSGRDYFQGALSHANDADGSAVHTSRVLRAE